VNRLLLLTVYVRKLALLLIFLIAECFRFCVCPTKIQWRPCTRPNFVLDVVEPSTASKADRRSDMTMPLSNMLQPPRHTTSSQVQPTSSPTQVFDGPITRSRAKKLQQEVHALLYEFQLNTNENFMLPKSCMFILLRFTKEERKNISRVNQQEELCPSQSSATEPYRRNHHIF
jgi:hypothetical protein